MIPRALKTNRIGWILFVARDHLGIAEVILSVRDPVLYRHRIIRSTGRFTAPRVETVGTSDSFCDRVSHTGAAVAVASMDAKTHPFACSYLREMRATAYFGAPIHDTQGKVVATLAAIDTQHHDWTSEDQRDLEQFAHLIEAILPTPKTAAGYSLMDFFPA